MDYLLGIVNKYKARLDADNDPLKIVRALQKLDEIDMTVAILEKSGVGKAVNAIKKVDNETVSEIARELIQKWKKLLRINQYPAPPTGDQYTNQSVTTNDEYDPSGNWKMKKSNNVAAKRRVEEEESYEYDPTQNWKMHKKSKRMKKKQESDGEDEASVYDPSTYSSHKAKPKNLKKKNDKLDNNERSFTKVRKVHDNHVVSDDEYPSSREIDDAEFDNKYEPGESKSHHPAYVPSHSGKTHHKKPLISETIHENTCRQEKIIKKSRKEDLSSHKKSFSSKTASYEKQYNHSKDNGTKNHKSVAAKHNNNSLVQLKASKPTTTQPSSKIGVKRKSPETNQTTNKKIKTEHQSTSKKTEKKKPKAQDMSFEQFMKMDTSKIKKKKKKVSRNSPVPISMPQNDITKLSKPKVELHLPEVQATYRPLPIINHQLHSNALSKADKMTDEMAAELHTQRNSKRMQVYSGKKLAYIPKMMSLFDQCMNVLMNNIERLDVIGVPYDIIEPVLERCTVDQLYRLEDSNVYLLDDTDVLWRKHAMQDFRGHEPDELESWREMYLRLHDAREAKLAKLTHSIAAKLNQAKPLEKRTKLAYVGVGQAKPPRNVMRAQLKYGTAGKKPIPFQGSGQSNLRSSAATGFKQQATEIRMSIPVGSITADTVDEPSHRSASMKKQAPRIAPMMAKTLKSIKQRYRR
ncbi:unnamed protein product [Clavelina lepadiformis]|uniref:TFIIS N-terminal domain-containing protein n=1 Tax=Clavelina lepadiformis TaxID=159417 RepID=A0ABP0FUQ0_CLALP